MREAAIEKALVARVVLLGGEVRKVGWIGRVGAPDRVVMLPGCAMGPTVWVELKAPGKKIRPSQEREHVRMKAVGQVVLVIDSLPQIDLYFPIPESNK